jgi:hypothetical protein
MDIFTPQDIQALAFIKSNALLFAVIGIYVTTVKGFALWRAAQLAQKKWFIALLIINTFGILELVYLFFISKKYSVEIKKI